MRFLSYIISNPIAWLQYVTYQVIKPVDNWEDISDRLEACLFDIKSWMCMNILQLNQDKIELIIFAPKHKVKSLTKLQFNFDGAILSESSCVRNLGVFFDQTLSMEQYASAITKSCFHQIRNIGRIRSYITVDACKTLVCSLVASRMDYGNALINVWCERLNCIQTSACSEHCCQASNSQKEIWTYNSHNCGSSLVSI